MRDAARLCANDNELQAELIHILGVVKEVISTILMALRERITLHKLQQPQHALVFVSKIPYLSQSQHPRIASPEKRVSQLGAQVQYLQNDNGELEAANAF